MQNARLISFSFAGDKISVNGESYFSANSLVILKHSFSPAFCWRRRRIQRSDIRVAILDTVEDKGMAPDRSQNFQKLLVAASEATQTEHQIIFATAMIADELDDPSFTVVSFSSHESRTLQV